MSEPGTYTNGADHPSGDGPQTTAPAAADPAAARTEREQKRARRGRRSRGSSRRAPRAPKPEGTATAAREPDEVLEPEPVASEDQLRADLAVAIRFPWELVNLGAFLFGFKLEPLTEDEAAELGERFLPWLSHFRALALVVHWGTAPWAFVAKVKSKLSPRKSGATA